MDTIWYNLEAWARGLGSTANIEMTSVVATLHIEKQQMATIYCSLAMCQAM